MDEPLIPGSGGDPAHGEPGPAESSQKLVQTPTGPGGVSWHRAVLVRPGPGVRALTDLGPRDMQVVCDSGTFSLDAVLQRRAGPGWFVLGQVFLLDGVPARELKVELHVDEKAAGVLRTDAFGEFAFASKPGRCIGVALHGDQVALVELWRKN